MVASRSEISARDRPISDGFAGRHIDFERDFLQRSVAGRYSARNRARSAAVATSVETVLRLRGVSLMQHDISLPRPC